MNTASSDNSSPHVTLLKDPMRKKGFVLRRNKINGSGDPPKVDTRLWKTKTAKRILFLADRNILVDQTIVNDFSPFGEVMTKLDRKLVDKDGRINTSSEIYLGLYQSLIGDETRDNLYEKFDRDFFDLVVIDECH